MSEENILLSRSRYDSIMERLARFEEERKKESKAKKPTMGPLITNEETTGIDMEKQGSATGSETPSDDDDVNSPGREREDIYQDNKALLPPRGYVFNDNTNPETLDLQKKKRKTQPDSAGVIVRASPKSGRQRKKKRLKPPKTINPWISLV